LYRISGVVDDNNSNGKQTTFNQIPNTRNHENDAA
jgi:hypothetical protein